MMVFLLCATIVLILLASSDGAAFFDQADRSSVSTYQQQHGGSATLDTSTNSSRDPPQLPQGLSVDHNVISEAAWKTLQHWLDHEEFIVTGCSKGTTTTIASPIPWQMGAQHRRVAQFGFRYNYNTSVVEYAEDVPEIPLPLRQLLLESSATVEKLLRRRVQNASTCEHWDPTSFTQCIINVYEADDIIPWHWDHVDFGPAVLVFTFGEDRPLLLRRLKPSLLLLRDDTPASETYPRTQCHHNEGYSDHDYHYCTAYPKHGSCYLLSGPVRYQWEHSVPKGSGFRVSITFRTHRKDHNVNGDNPQA